MGSVKENDVICHFQGAGLRNLGNTCYLNSVLQCLTYTEPLAAYLQSGKHKSSCELLSAFSIFHHPLLSHFSDHVNAILC